VAAKAARVFLFLLPGGRPRRWADEVATAATIAIFFLLPFGRPGPHFLGKSTPPTAEAAPTEAATVGTVTAAAARAARVFWLRLPNGQPCLRDTGGVATGLSAFLSLPFGRPSLRFSGAPSPPVLGPPREDMVGLRSDGKSEAEEVVERALNPEHPRLLKRRGTGKEAGVMGSVAPNTSVTAPLSSRRAHPREVNHRGHHSGSWVELMGHDADARQAMLHDVSRSYCGDRRVQATRHYTVALRPVAAWVQTPKRFKFRGAGRVG
jgi:hypothetical protein